jgi:penicillin-binding protein 1A
MVGGTAASQVNRATRPRRIGSLFLPVVAATAFDFGYTPVSILNDEPFSVSRSDGTWYSPVNDDGKYMGPITLRQVIEHSRNVAAMRLLESLAPQSVLRYAQRLGLRGNFRLGPELASGGPEATLVEVTSAYATIANKGVRVEPHSIKSVTRADGTVVEQELPQPQDGIREDTAFMTTYLLTGVVERGTGTAARSLNWTLPGMTGTVLDNGDAWFVGFDPDMTVGVWVGHSGPTTCGQPPSRCGRTSCASTSPCAVTSRIRQVSTRPRVSFSARSATKSCRSSAGRSPAVNRALAAADRPA